MKRLLVVGASGFLGGHLASGLLAAGHRVRCLARTPAKLDALAKAGAEVVQGDILELESLQRALSGIDAVYLCMHTLSRQQGTAGFMDLELQGLRNVLTACRDQGVRRVIYVTFLGISPEAKSAWVRGRWQAEQLLVTSGLDATVLRPAQIVGCGGNGFDLMMGQARRRFTPVLGSGRQRWRNIALDDLVYYLLGVLDDPRAYGRCFDVGCDEVLTTDQMIDLAASVLGRAPPAKLHVPPGLVSALAPLIERLARLPTGALRGMLDSIDEGDADGDPLPIRALLPRPPLPYRQAIERALAAPSPQERSQLPHGFSTSPSEP